MKIKDIPKRIKENIGLIIAFSPIAFFLIVIGLLLTGILKIHIEF